MTTTTWERIAQDIRDRIISGETPVGTAIASFQQLSMRHHASVGSVKRAVQQLSTDGILEGRQGSGVYVIASPATAAPSLEERVAEVERLEDRVADLERRLAALEQRED